MSCQRRSISSGKAAARCLERHDGVRLSPDPHSPSEAAYAQNRHMSHEDSLSDYAWTVTVRATPGKEHDIRNETTALRSNRINTAKEASMDPITETQSVIAETRSSTIKDVYRHSPSSSQFDTQPNPINTPFPSAPHSTTPPPSSYDPTAPPTTETRAPYTPPQTHSRAA